MKEEEGSYDNACGVVGGAFQAEERTSMKALR